ncbi:MAG: hypothetical protein GF317_24035, partial [Candidatus Lokiarchaeota archaeon]|nr:hypothetical protein [Candidatus Lokiarchaeota archaeon]MBD3202443.1 hypothetical protein [Candidatus Lokiarchaeota archaeon]
MNRLNIENLKNFQHYLHEFQKSSRRATKNSNIKITFDKKYGKQIRIDDVKIAIDHWNPAADLIFFSHPHMDHIPNIPKKSLKQIKDRVLKRPLFICSKISKEIAELRTRKKFSFPGSMWLLGNNLNLKSSVDYKGLTLSLIENGHTYGSCSLFIEGSERIFYTSDFTGNDKFLNTPFTALRGLKPLECEHLITECTYGLPKYIFPSFPELSMNINQNIQNNLLLNIPTIILAYSYGKSQTILNSLNPSFNILLEKSIAKIVKKLEALDLSFNSWQPYGKYNKNQLMKLRDYVLIIPPYEMFKEPYKTLIADGANVIYLSGKTFSSDARERFPADHYYPYSDHCDYNQLIDFVQNTNPEHIYLEHGNMSAFYYALNKLDITPNSEI